jgi:hypothetical protein
VPLDRIEPPDAVAKRLERGLDIVTAGPASGRRGRLLDQDPPPRRPRPQGIDLRGRESIGEIGLARVSHHDPRQPVDRKADLRVGPGLGRETVAHRILGGSRLAGRRPWPGAGTGILAVCGEFFGADRLAGTSPRRNVPHRMHLHPFGRSGGSSLPHSSPTAGRSTAAGCVVQVIPSCFVRRSFRLDVHLMFWYHGQLFTACQSPAAKSIALNRDPVHGVR